MPEEALQQELPAEETASTEESWEQSLEASKGEISAHEGEETSEAEVELEQSPPDSDTESVEEQQPEQTEKVADQAEETTDEETQLLTEEEETEFSRLNTPEEQKKFMNRAYTKKTQKLSARQKELDRLVQLEKAYEVDPLATIRLLAKEHNLEISDPSQPGQQPQQPAVPSTETVSSGETGRVAVQDFLKMENLELLSTPFDLFRDELRQEVKAEIQAALNPVQQFVTDQQEQSHNAALVAAMSQMDQEFGPEWRNKSGEVLAASKQFVQGGNTSTFDYLRGIYGMVNGDEVTAKKVVEETQKVVDKVNKSAQAVEALKPGSGVGSKTVSETPPENESWWDSMKASKRKLARRG